MSTLHSARPGTLSSPSSGLSVHICHRQVSVSTRSMILPSGKFLIKSHRRISPINRDDPSVDENTRLRNRIAELESLVRELRGEHHNHLIFTIGLLEILLGKPHPRWADSNFRDGDPNEKWHSRATKCMSAQKRGSQPQSPQQPQQNGQHTTDSGGGGNASGGGGDPRNGVSTRGMQSLLSPIKSEPITDTNNNAHLYRFSPSPAPSMRYHTFQQGDVRAGPDSQAQSGYPTTNGATTNGYHHSSNSTGSHYSGNSNLRR
jgi:hypothetical protein